MSSSWEQFKLKKTQLALAIKQADGEVALGKTTSNLFRTRSFANVRRLDVRNFHGVIDINPTERTVNVEGMTTYEELVDASLAQGFMPAVVPQLKSITVGGAIAGLGIEATSFRYGLVHETLIEIEILLGDGQVVIATPHNEYADLFFGFPNSYGTLGYVLRAKLLLIPVKPFVKITHIKIADPHEYFKAMGQAIAIREPNSQAGDFLDGVVFEVGEQNLSTAHMIDDAPKPSDYTRTQIYYRSIRTRTTDYMTIKDYIWRWDTDWFWCSKNFPGAQNQLMRLLFGKFYLKSTFYWKLMALDSRHHILERLDKLSGKNGQTNEVIIQDVEIPLDKSAAFLDFFQTSIGIKPIWICPLQAYKPNAAYTLYPLDPQKPYINFGFWDTIPSDQPPGYYNRLIEAKVTELGGKKSLYSDSYYTAEEFWSIFDKPKYDTLKQKYDPTNRFKNLFDKVVKNR